MVRHQLERRSIRDAPLAIGYGQTTTRPYMTALMAELLELRGSEKILDIGSGSGYHAAVLGAQVIPVGSREEQDLRVPRRQNWREHQPSPLRLPFRAAYRPARLGGRTNLE